MTPIAAPMAALFSIQISTALQVANQRVNTRFNSSPPPDSPSAIVNIRNSIGSSSSPI